MSSPTEIELLEKVTKNPFGKYNGNEARYVLEVLDSENPKNKELPWATRLEDAFAKKMGLKYAVAHNSGTSTLHSCLVAAGVVAGDEVIVPAQTVIMCGWAPIYHNASPVYVDSDPQTSNMVPEDVRRKITPKTKAIIVVHMHGLPADVPAIMRIAEEHGITVIEDCAQCVMGTIHGELVGTIGHLSSFSLETKKHLSTGEGGMVATNDEALATKVRKHAGLGYKTLTAGSGLRAILPREFQNPAYKRHDTLAWNYRMPELTAAVGLAQLERVDAIIDRRRKIGALYLEVVRDCPWLVPQEVPAGYDHTYWTFILRYEGEDATGLTWSDFYDLHAANGGDGFYAALSIAYEEPAMKERQFYGTYIPENRQLYPNEFVFPKGTCPRAEAYQPKIMKWKTNYRDLDVAKAKIAILRKTIDMARAKGAASLSS